MRHLSLVARVGLGRVLEHRRRERLGALHADQHATREHRVDEAEGVADERPARAAPPAGAELVVRVLDHGRHARRVRRPSRGDCVRAQQAVELLFGALAEAPQVVGRHHEADGHPARQRNAPGPAALEAVGVDVAFDQQRHALEVGVERGVPARSGGRPELEEPSHRARAAARVDDEIRLPLEKAAVAAIVASDSRIRSPGPRSIAAPTPNTCAPALTAAFSSVASNSSRGTLYE